MRTESPSICSFRDELLAIEQFDSLLEAQVLVADWRDEYNTYRPHSALGMLTPSTFAARSRTEQPQLTASGPPTGGRSNVLYESSLIEVLPVPTARQFLAFGQATLRSQLRTILFEYVEVFYNRQRHQARLGHHTGRDLRCVHRSMTHNNPCARQHWLAARV